VVDHSYNYGQAVLVYDSLGTQHTVSQYFVKTDDTTVTVYTRSTAPTWVPR
jgi:flagellar hook protein FlgE